ncbi:C40 family peptidase [Flavobacterium panici]|uniref:LysM peptidoglycan-binding domain-containing protein n=1 Tax=Flavobacterium panici TaxID=2654843 RepID=A0A9N8J4J4_9FLAO|nr:LysM peptidoglycan-binding domain-containing protein [Flavobacterium panici]CAC9975117.1 LysM peptidoglycan-binding domain-containing protein [Flavobacterium panici]
MVFRLIIVLFFFSVGAFSQEKFTKHKISKGENLTVIAKKYGLKAKDIKEANPDAPKVLKLNSILLIPNKNVKSSQNTPQTIANNTPGSHEVLQKETLWGIAKKYNVSVDELKKANPTLETEGLKIGQQLNIPSKAQAVSENTVKINEAKPEIIPAADGEIVVEVQPKETKFSIAKKYGITVEELERQNPFIKGNLGVGYMLKIRPSGGKTDQNIKDTPVVSQTQTAEKPESTPVTDVDIFVEVQPKETKYAIAKKYGITVKELERQNPFIKGKLPVGYVLKIRTTKEKADALNAVSSPVPQLENQTTAAPAAQIADNTVIKKDSTFVYNGNHSDLIDQLILNATENIGTRYRSGGTTKAGFDCSGLMFCTFGNFDIKLPRSSIEQSRIGTKVATTEAQKGDLIFFKTNGRRQINHVGMVVENADGEIKFVHSSTHGGVMISSTKEAYYQRAFSQINRILE